MLAFYFDLVPPFYFLKWNRFFLNFISVTREWNFYTQFGCREVLNSKIAISKSTHLIFILFEIAFKSVTDWLKIYPHLVVFFFLFFFYFLYVLSLRAMKNLLSSRTSNRKYNPMQIWNGTALRVTLSNIKPISCFHFSPYN